MFLCRWEIAASLLNGGADTLSYAGGHTQTHTDTHRCRRGSIHTQKPRHPDTHTDTHIHGCRRGSIHTRTDTQTHRHTHALSSRPRLSDRAPIPAGIRPGSGSPDRGALRGGGPGRAGTRPARSVELSRAFLQPLEGGQAPGVELGASAASPGPRRAGR